MKLLDYYKPHDHKHGFQICVVLMRPKSRGYIKLSSTNPYEKVIINPNYLSHPLDVKTLIEGIRIAHRVAFSEEFTRKFNSRHISTDPLPGCEKYELFSDAYLECHIRTFTQTLYHPSGTCKMADDSSGVVDSKLRVKGGVKGLRVVDASIMPNIVTGEFLAEPI